MSILDGINNYAVSNKGSEEGYRHLRDRAAALFNDLQATAADVFMIECNEAEDTFCQTNYANDPDARHTKGRRKGQWKKRTLLPQSYNTAKSALYSALEAGIDPAGLGKTALDKVRKERTQRIKTPAQLVNETIETLFKRLDKVEDPTLRTSFCDIIVNGLRDRGYYGN